MNTGVIDQFLGVFTSYIDSGFGLLHGEVAFLSSTLIAIDITLAALFWALAADEDVLTRLIRKTLYVGFFAFLIGNFNGLAKIVFNSFAGLGLKAAGSSLSADQFVQPGRIAQVGIDAGMPILKAAGQLMGFTSFFQNFVQIFVLLVAWLIVLAAFFILAVQLFITLIEFKLTTLAGFILVPFGLFNKTAFLAEKVLGNVVASGVKVLVLAIIVGIGTTLFGQFTQGFADQPTIQDALALVLAALSMLGLGIFGPGIATGLVSGAPQLGPGAAVGTSLAAGGLGVAGTVGARAALSTVGSAASGIARGGAFVMGSAASAYELSAAASGQSGVRGAMAGLSGVAAAGVSAAVEPVSRMTDRIADNLNMSFAEGGRAAFRATGQGAPSSTSSHASAASGSEPDAAPEWARRLRRSQAASHGISTAAHAVRSGDHGGGSAEVDLSEESK
ncbi:type IV secretion system protein TrbL [Rhizobiales bacterium GAS113]|nr:type IV secretion system protein TrbL [Rhizobiales bacterium GAS113]